MAYCEIVDLLIGDLPTSLALSPQKYVNDAADEIDSKIGFVYETPIPVDTFDPTPRPVVLLLKRLNAHLATGRMILAATIIAEDEQLNAYGKRMVEDAELTLVHISTGQLLLDGVLTSGLSALPAPHVPMIMNKDTESAVDAFYDRIANPSYTFVTNGNGTGFVN